MGRGRSRWRSGNSFRQPSSAHSSPGSPCNLCWYVHINNGLRMPHAFGVPFIPFPLLFCLLPAPVDASGKALLEMLRERSVASRTGSVPATLLGRAIRPPQGLSEVLPLPDAQTCLLRPGYPPSFLTNVRASSYRPPQPMNHT